MPRLYLLQWLKSDRALMMLFNDGTFQVSTRTRNNIPASHKDHKSVKPMWSFSKGQLLPRPHQDHPLLSERRVRADLHQRGPRLQNLQPQLLVDVGVPRWPARTHGLLPQHALAAMQLNYADPSRTEWNAAVEQISEGSVRGELAGGCVNDKWFNILRLSRCGDSAEAQVKKQNTQLDCGRGNKM